MTAVLGDDGKIVIPEELRNNAQLKAGDKLEVQLYKGTLLLRKHQALTDQQCATLLKDSPGLPAATAQDEETLDHAIREVRANRR
jgi:AbrB family looped-hinge helix DNA binding protein